MIGLRDLILCLRRSASDNLRCLGCGYEHACSIHGCRVMKEAANRLEELQNVVLRIRRMHTKAKGAEKALLGEVLVLLEASL